MLTLWTTTIRRMDASFVPGVESTSKSAPPKPFSTRFTASILAFSARLDAIFTAPATPRLPKIPLSAEDESVAIIPMIAITVSSSSREKPFSELRKRLGRPSVAWGITFMDAPYQTRVINAI